MSYYFKVNQMEYYDKLMEVRKNGKYEEYIKFFLYCLDAAEDSVIKKMIVINELHKKNIEKLPLTNRKKNSYEIIFNYIEKNPIFTLTDIVKAVGLSFNTVNESIKKFNALNIVKKQNEARRNKLYIYEEYLEIFRRAN